MGIVGAALSRRTFLKYATAGGAMAVGGGPGPAVAQAIKPKKPPTDFEQHPFTDPLIWRPEDASLPDRVVRSGCSFCPSACWHQVHVKDGRVVNVYGEPNNPVQADELTPQDGGLCAKGRIGIVQLLYNKYRITRPLKRVGPKPSMKFQPVSWDEAYRDIARRLLEIRDTDGPHAIAGKTTDRVSRDGGPPLFRLLHMLGSSNPTHEGYICNDGLGIALDWVYGQFGMTNSYGWDAITKSYDLGDSKFVLWFGSNDAEMHPITHAWMRKRKEVVKSTWVVIDPRMTPTAFAADLWVPVKPGTDMALAYGMIHHIIAQNLYDREFVAKWVEGFDDLRKFVNDKGYTPEWGEKITGISADTIKKMAVKYATIKPAAIFVNAGIAHHVNCVDTTRVLAYLVAITGNLGVPGGGCNVLHNAPVGLSLPGLQFPEPADKAWHDKHAFKQPGLPPQPDYFRDAILKGKPYKLKAVVYHGNPLTQNSNAEESKQALKDIFYVKIAMFPEEDAEYADYVLPNTTFYEMDHVHRRVDRGLVWRDKVIDPIGDSKQDMLIYAELCEYMARFDTHLSPRFWRENFPTRWPRDKRYLWNEVAPKNAGGWSGGMSADRMQKMLAGAKAGEPHQRYQPILKAPCPPADHPSTQALAPDQRAPDGGHPGFSVWFLDHPAWRVLYDGDRFGANKKRWGVDKVMISHPKYDAELRKFGHTAIPEFYSSPETMDGLPTVEYSNEFVKMFNVGNSPAGNVVQKVKIGVKPDPELRKKYPIQLTTGRPGAAHFHTVTHWAWSLVQISGDRFVQMHPKLAAQLKVKTGDTVKVETPRASLVGPALVWDGIQENTVFIPHTFGPGQKVHEDVGRKAWETVNKLTAHYYDNLSGQNEYKCQLCRVTKV